MSNILDDIFKHPPATLPYSFTMTDFDLGSPLSPAVFFATGTLTFEYGMEPGKAGGPIAFYKFYRRYIDSRLTMSQGTGLYLKPPAMTTGGWANELLLMPASQGSYIVQYRDQQHPVSSFTVAVEAQEGNFFGGQRTAVLVGRYWRGALVLVLALEG